MSVKLIDLMIKNMYTSSCQTKEFSKKLARAISGKFLFFYMEVEAEGILVDCIYLDDGECRAQPRQRLGEKKNYYKPSEDDKKQYCKADFKRCPRFSAYQDHLKAVFPIFGKKGQ